MLLKSFVVFALLVFPVSVRAATPDAGQPNELLAKPALQENGRVLWRVSIATLVTANALDAGSSLGKQESNPVLRSSDGAFGVRGLVIKSGLTAATVGMQCLLRRYHVGSPRVFAVLNFIQSGATAGVAIHNLQLRNSGQH